MKSTLTQIALLVVVVALVAENATAIRVGLCKRLTKRQRQLTLRDNYPGASCTISDINRDIRQFCTTGICGPLNRSECKAVIRAELIDVTFPANCNNLGTPCTNPQECTAATCRGTVDLTATFPANCAETCSTSGTCPVATCAPSIPECPTGQQLSVATCACEVVQTGACSSDSDCADVNACRPGVCTDDLVCETFTRSSCCVNDKNGRLIDSQCSTATPLCGTSVDTPTPLGSTGTTCYFCEDDRTGTGVDNGCTSASPFCAAADGSNAGTDGLGDGCFSCQSTSAVTDTGCASNTPLCGSTTGIPAALNNYGNRCFTCINDGDGVDTGCSVATPTCDAAAGRLGSQCTVCKNTDAGTGVDFGCSAARPFCSTAADTDIPLNGQGAACFDCLDVTPIGARANLGCPNTMPNCNNGDQCVFCLNSVAAGTDFGCGGTSTICGRSNGTPLVNIGDAGDRCFVCENGSLDLDAGCPAATPICMTTEGTLGTACAVCQNDRALAGDRDIGCPAATPNCALMTGTLAINGFGDVCV